MTQNKKDESSSDDDIHNEFKDEVTRNKIDRHLSDVNDEISEEDIKNIISDISSTAPGVDETKLKIDEATPKNEEELPVDEKDKQKDLPTSWNVLD